MFWHPSVIVREAAGTKDESKGSQYLHELVGLEFL
jgi:hypothetical protein